MQKVQYHYQCWKVVKGFRHCHLVQTHHSGDDVVQLNQQEREVSWANQAILILHIRCSLSLVKEATKSENAEGDEPNVVVVTALGARCLLSHVPDDGVAGKFHVPAYLCLTIAVADQSSFALHQRACRLMSRSLSWSPYPDYTHRGLLSQSCLQLRSRSHSVFSCSVSPWERSQEYRARKQMMAEGAAIGNIDSAIKEKFDLVQERSLQNRSLRVHIATTEALEEPPRCLVRDHNDVATCKFAYFVCVRCILYR